jgi:hypothetical protein
MNVTGKAFLELLVNRNLVVNEAVSLLQFGEPRRSGQCGHPPQVELLQAR